jgi:hypothetical protein
MLCTDCPAYEPTFIAHFAIVPEGRRLQSNYLQVRSHALGQRTADSHELVCSA